MKCTSFWGLDAITKSLDFLYEHRFKFQDHTFFAHNGGFYDIAFLFREGLLTDDRFQIDSCIEQEGSYIHLTVFNGDSKIFFRDSNKLMPASLEKMCEELDVEHKKMTETVCHDEITIDNYHTFPALEQYLENDCKGLYEVLWCYNIEIKTAFDYEGEQHYKHIQFFHKTVSER